MFLNLDKDCKGPFVKPFNFDITVSNVRVSFRKVLEYWEYSNIYFQKSGKLTEFTSVSSSYVIGSIELRGIIFRLLKSSISRWVRCDSPIVVAMMAPMMIQSVSEELLDCDTMKFRI